MSTVRTKKRYSDALMDIIEQYRKENPGRPITMQEVAQWAVIHGQWYPKRRNPTRELAKDLARASRSKYTTDPQGRSVRAMHAARYERVDENGNRIIDVVWDHIYEMSLDHAEVSFEQRYQQMADEARALDRDMNSFNDNNPNAADGFIQKTFDFTLELQEPHEQVVQEIPSVSPRKPK